MATTFAFDASSDVRDLLVVTDPAFAGAMIAFMSHFTDDLSLDISRHVVCTLPDETPGR